MLRTTNSQDINTVITKNNNNNTNNNSTRNSNANNLTLSSDLGKVVLSKALLITSEITSDNFFPLFQKFYALIFPLSKELQDKFTLHFLKLVAIEIDSGTLDKKSPVYLLALEILNSTYIGSPVFRIKPFTEATDLPIRDIGEFIDNFDYSIIRKYIFLLDFAQATERYNVIGALQSNLPEVFEYIRNTPYIDPFDYFLLFELFLGSKHISLHEKLNFSARFAFSHLIDHPRSYKAILKFGREIAAMSMKEIFQQMDPSDLSPSNTFALTLKLRTDITETIVFVLKEILLPTSQQVSTNHTGLTSPDIVQSTAKGYSLEKILSSYASEWKDADWAKALDKTVSELDNDVADKITPASVSQFLVTLPPSRGLQDLFLSSLTLTTRIPMVQQKVVIALHELKKLSSVGGVNLFQLNLQPIVPQQASNIRESIIYYAGISKLEVRTISNLQRNQQSASNQLSAFFLEDVTDVPDYLALAACSLLYEDKIEKEDSNVFQILENLMIPLLDINSMLLPSIFEQLRTHNPTKLIEIASSYYKSNGIKSVVKFISHLPKEHLSKFLDCIASPQELVVASVIAGKLHVYEEIFQYLISKLKSYNDNDKALFIESFLSIVTAEVEFNLDPAYEERMPLDCAYMFMIFFDNDEIAGLIGKFHALDRYNELQVKFLQLFPRLSNYGFGHDEAIKKADANNKSFTQETELKMKTYFEQMYSRQVDIKDITDLLVKLKSSNNPDDQDLFACMLQSIIDEYRFYPTYPTEAIALTSVLFGSLIFFRLFEGTALKIALRYVLESARMPPDSNMFKFAVQALFASRARLADYKSYCAALASIDSLKSHKPLYNDIVAIAEGTYMAPPPPVVKEAPKKFVSKYKSIFVDVSKTSSDDDVTPPEEITEAVSFSLNNLSEKNLESNIADLQKKVTENYFQYFAGILVGQRAKLEPNYHQLYAKVVEGFNSNKFDETLVNTTFTEIVNILNKDEPSDSDRQHLKNLGSWLGLITIKRSKPLKHKNILPEALLVESYDLKTLPIILPFVSKIIAATKDSEVFKYPNPWTLGPLQLMKELYEFGDLTLNLKFEIEVLCNTLRISLTDLESSTIIRTHTPSYVLDLRAEIDSGRNEGKLALFKSANQDNYLLQQQLQQQQQLLQLLLLQQQQQQLLLLQLQLLLQQQLQLLLQLQQQQLLSQQIPSPFDISSAFDAIVNQSHNLVLLQSENIKNLFQFALTRAIKELLPSMVERINSIAIHTTRNLVLKDFALDLDDNKLYSSANHLLTTLIENLTPVQCRETLKQSILIVVRSTLGDDFAAAEEQLTLALEEVTPIGVELIKNTAMKGAIADLEKFLAPNYLTRRSYRGSPQQFTDVNVASRYAIGLPDPLGLRPGGVTAEQFSVYENFGRQSLAISRSNLLQLQLLQLQQTQHFDDHSNGAAGFANGAPTPIHPPQAQLNDPQFQQLLFAQPQGLETMLEQTLDKILNATLESPLTSISELTDDNPIQLYIAQVLAFCLRTPQKDAALLTLAQLVVQALFTLCEKPLTLEVFVSLLESACAFSPSALYDVSHWFIQVYDERKFIKEVIICLLKSGGLITSAELDTSLSTYILQKNESATKFAISLIEEVVESKNIELLRSEFIGMIAALRVSEDPDAKQLFEKMNKVQTQEGVSLEEQFGYIFAQWVKICEHDMLPNADKIRTVFIKQLLDSNILSEKETFVKFLRMAVEISVIAFNKENDSKKKKVDFYLTTDAFADLLIEIIINIEDDDKFTQRGTILDVMLSVVVAYFAEDHKSVTSFNQRPYFRIFSSLLTDFSEYVAKFPEYALFETKFYSIILDKLIAMQPLAFPGFTFAWISLISHRLFLPKILKKKTCWNKYIALLNALLRLQSTYITGKQVPDMLVLVYKGTLRIMLLLLHDFPELLVENHYQLTVNIPQCYVQLRNIVLSAFPSNLSFPDPFQPGLKIERIPEISELPVIAYNPLIDLENASKSLKKNVENYMRVPSKATLKNIISALTLPEPRIEGGIGYTKINYNLKLVNALVLYIGMIAVNEKQSTFATNSSECIFLKDLMLESSVELQYQLFEAICNQLRYPNAHTHWFSCIIIYLFSSQSLWGSKREDVQQLITRVLLERTIANRPHPWGLLITFTELLKNTEYAFFDLPFTKNAPELKTLFGSLLRHISNSSTTVHTPTAA